MKRTHRLKFVVLKYAPSVLSNCFVNIAVLGYEVDTGRFGDARFLDGWEPALKLDPNADIEMLDGLKKEIQSSWPNIERREMLLKTFLDSFSNSIQISQEQTCLTNNPEDEMRDLVLRYLSPTVC
jgi:Protein of unknown function (DUF3037)